MQQLCWIQGAIIQSEKKIWKGHMFCEFVYIKFSKWQNYGDGEQISDCKA